MGTVTLVELFQLYLREEITDQQLLGHLLQHMLIMHKTLQTQQQEIDGLRAFVGMEQERYKGEAED